MIRRITPPTPYCDSLNRERLTAIKQRLKESPELAKVFYGFLQKRSNNESSQVRFLCLQLLHYVFTRSAHFRAIFCRSYFIPFLNLYKDELPPPLQFANRLRSIIFHVVDQWIEDFGQIYPQLRILKKTFRIRESKHDLEIKERLVHYTILVDKVIDRYQPVLDEMNNLINLLVPNTRIETEFYPPTEDCKEIILSSLKEYKNIYEEINNTIDLLLINSSRYSQNESIIKKLNQFAEFAGHIGEISIKLGIDEDDFDDIDSDDSDVSSENDDS